MTATKAPLALATAIALVVTLLSHAPAHAHPRSNETPSFNESSGCGEVSGIVPPMADVTNPDASRVLPSSAQVRGPWANFYGRTYSDVQGSLVLWTVPMSGGSRVWVNERALPAFQEVSRLLAIEEANGRYYAARIASTFSWRRVGGSYRMSHHAFGTTIDINRDTNPYISTTPPPPRAQYTDMPEWYVEAWRQAGFCWGGDWLGVKDAMHFSWKGPMATPGYGAMPEPFSPDGATADFTNAETDLNPDFGPDRTADQLVVGDVSRDGAPDLVRIRQSGQGSLRLSIAHASHDFARCGVLDFTTGPTPFDPDGHGVADLNGDSRAEIWVVGDVGGQTRVAYTDPLDDYRTWTEITTGVSPQHASVIRFADHDRDGFIDLYAIEKRSSDLRLRIYDGGSGWSTLSLDSVVAINPNTYPLIDVADRGGDGLPDVIASSASAAILRFASGSSGYTYIHFAPADLPGATEEAHWADWDGDGRDDLYAVQPDGTVALFAGGSGVSNPTFWFLPSGWECLPVSYPAVPFDFDGDGYPEVVAPSSREDVGTVHDAGAVFVVDGARGLFSGVGSMWSQATSGVLGGPEWGDRFGEAHASGDFNADGYADLAIGVAGENLSGLTNPGQISVLFGSEDGLTAAGDQTWNQDSAGVSGVMESGDRLGASLVSGDFNGDGLVDLAAGAPGEAIGTHTGSGAVNVFYGDRWKGLVGGGLIHQDTAGVPGVVEAGDGFGAVLAAGDFNADGFDDLAVGSPDEHIGNRADSGIIHVIPGGSGGLDPTSSISIHFGQTGHTLQSHVRFGEALASGDIDGDGHDDLAVGAPGVNGSGAVVILPGTSSGLSSSAWPLLTQGASGVGGAREPGDGFGAALQLADFDGDGFYDLVVGVPGEDLDTVTDAGMIHVVRGSAAGPDMPSTVDVSQRRSSIWGNPESGDAFGSTLWVADFDHDGADDVLVGVPYESIDGKLEAGAVVLVPGQIGGLVNLSRSRALYQGQSLGGGLESGDQTGR